MLQSKYDTHLSGLSFWAHLVSVCLQVDNEGWLLKSWKQDSFSPTSKSSLKRQTATTHLKVQHQPLIGQDAKQNGTPQGEEVKGATFPSQTNGSNNQPYAQTKLVPLPYSNLQTQRNMTLTLPSKVCWIMLLGWIFYNRGLSNWFKFREGTRWSIEN